MSIETQAQHVLQIWAKCRFTLRTIIDLYLVQESFDVAEERICSLSDGQITEDRIAEEIGRYKLTMELAGDSGLARQVWEKNLKNAIAHIENTFARETKISPIIRQRQNALASLEQAFAFIDQIPSLAKPELYTTEVQAQLAARIERLKEFKAKVERQLVDLNTWHEIELRAGRFQLMPFHDDPSPSFPPGGIIHGSGTQTEETDEARA